MRLGGGGGRPTRIRKPRPKPISKPAKPTRAGRRAQQRAVHRVIAPPRRVGKTITGTVRRAQTRSIRRAPKGRRVGRAIRAETTLGGHHAIAPFNRPLKAPGTHVAGINVGKIPKTSARAALDILDQTTRGSEFEAGAFSHTLKRIQQGEQPFDPVGNLKAGWESGGSRKHRKTFSDVLGQAGMKKGALREGLGFAFDVGLDPTTYITFGTGAAAHVGGSVAARAAAKAGAKAEAEALAKGLGRKAARKAKSRASRAAFNKAPKARGITVGVGRARTSGRTTATIGEPARVALERPGRALREKASKIIPVRPPDISPQEWERLQAAGREYRGTALHEMRRSAGRVRAIKKAAGGTTRRVIPERPAAGTGLRVRPGLRPKPIPLEASRRITDALEANDLSKLSPLERQAAAAIQHENKRLLKLRRDAGERPKVYQPRSADEPSGYVPRQPILDLPHATGEEQLRFQGQAKQLKKLERRAQRTGPKVSSRKTTTLKDFERTERRPMSVVRQERPGVFAEDLETVLRSKAAKDISRAASTRYRGRVAALGKPFAKAKRIAEDEAVYTTKGKKLTEVQPKKLREHNPRDLVVLKRSVAEHANAQMEHVGRIPFVDSATSKIKWALTIPNPQYWARNLYGGMFNVFEEGAPAKGVGRAAPLAVKVGRQQTKRAKALETLGKKPPKPEPLPLGPGGKKVDVDEFIDELERANVSGGGVTTELLGAETRRRSKAQLFEDLPRLTAYIHFRRAGLSVDDAARRALNSQFDYGNLTNFERKVARRIFPFYTWRSRNIILQGKTLVTRPGKLATVEKARDSAARASGLPDDWQKGLSEGEALGVPVPVPGLKLASGKGLVYPSLPVTDLNLFTTNPGAFLKQIGGSAHPLGRAVIEFATNYNLYWRSPIEQDYQRWQSAPSDVIDRLPKQLQDRLIKAGVIRRGRDAWSGKMTWQWRGKADYIAKFTPLTSTLLQTATAGRSRKGQTGTERAFGYLTGLRPQAYQPQFNALTKLYNRREKLYKQKADLEELWQLNKAVGRASAPAHAKREYEHVQDQLEKLRAPILKLEKAQGKKIRSKSRGTTGGGTGGYGSVGGAGYGSIRGGGYGSVSP